MSLFVLLRRIAGWILRTSSWHETDTLQDGHTHEKKFKKMLDERILIGYNRTVVD
jgi:hypothetical protein